MKASNEKMPNPSLSCEPNGKYLFFSVSINRVLPSQRKGIKQLLCTVKSGIISNLGGTTDLLIVRPKLIFSHA